MYRIAFLDWFGCRKGSEIGIYACVLLVITETVSDHCIRLVDVWPDLIGRSNCAEKKSFLIFLEFITTRCSSFASCGRI